MREHERRPHKKVRSLVATTALRALALFICPVDDILAATVLSSNAFHGNPPPAILTESQQLIVVAKKRGKEIDVWTKLSG
ncbi:MAG: hypothetical protein HYT06_00125 [Candidatus Levybacteria bacterium]|nr:hypothetical protein [Candidatus Levybacteria bacterium]